MTAGNANDDFDDELLSAYVDGELTAAERALVEERLRSDPMAAALVDELRSLSSAIKSLPRETLSRDLRVGVLAEVEQAQADSDARGPATLPLTPVDRWAGIRRGLAWSALAIAATVLIAIFQPAELAQDERDLARAEKRQAEEAQADAELEQLERRLRPAAGASEAASVDQLAAANNRAEPAALPPGLRGSMGVVGVDANAPSGENAVEMAALPATAAAPEELRPAAAPLAATPGVPAISADGTVAEASAGKLADLDAFAESAANGQPRADAVALHDSLDRSGALMAPLSSSPEDASSLENAAPASAAAPAGVAMGGMGGGAAESFRGGAAFGDGGQATVMRAARAGAPAAEMPQAKVTLQLASNEGVARFEQFLAESDIARAEVGEGIKEAGGERVLELAPRTSFNRAADDAKHDAAGQQERSLYFFFAPSPSQPEAADKVELGVELDSAVAVKQLGANLIWVEATPAQIDALLEKCRHDKEAFAAVLADDDPLLAKKAESDAAELKLKGAARADQAPTKSEAAVAASDKRERVLFMLEPATPALESTLSPEAGEAK
ncbi:anti-sigma factor family protein [Lacipirellula limnantheis]|uniref:Putative zinc-finger domain-containing protein n=1 Tax=Lacipirellula limnantheis TaxID=2528024 RepID=A0A517U6A2_9BACT|nr:zf-HC2 domain-containing protein [Lacipirellula limnantheis]QDT76144.1 hypothetical protein I41_53890 [Lacipirellula limnantheis]